MRRVRHSAASLSISLLPFAISLCAAVALALPPNAEAAIHLGSTNTVSLSNGLAGYWPLDGSVTDWHTNTTRDLSGNGNTGSLALMSTSSSPTIGKIGQALNFNGATNKISITSSSAISWSAGQKFSVSAWLKVASHDGTNREIVRKGDGGDGTGWFLLLNQANNIAFTSSGTAPEYTGGSPYPADNNWHMATGTFDGSRIDVYLDGKNVANYAGSGPDTNTDQLMLGAYSGGVQYFLGGLDEVRIYNRALSATEVKQLYNLGTAKIGHSNIAISNGLVGYWPLDGNTTNWATGKTSDISGNGNDGSLGAMSTSSSPIIGRIGEAFNFDGTSQYIPTSVNTTVTSATFSAWIKMTTAPGFSGIVYSRGTTVTGIGFGLDYTLSYTWNNDPSTWGWYTGLVVPIGRWVFVAVAVQPTYATAYLYDPTSGLQSAVNVTAHSATTIDDLLIGRDEFDVRYFPGLIDDVRLYNRALSTTEIKQLYNLGVAKIGHSNVAISNGLVGYWTFDGGSIDWRTNTVRDMSGNGNDGSLGAMSTTTSPVIGKIGSAMSFGGTNQQIRVGTVGGIQTIFPFPHGFIIVPLREVTTKSSARTIVITSLFTLTQVISIGLSSAGQGY